MTATPYETFLTSSDLDTWRTCLHDAAALARRDPSPEAMAQALCLAMYVQWLGQVSGRLSVRDEAQAREAELRTALEDRTSSGGSEDYRAAWGLILAWTGYRNSARELLERGGVLAVEHLLLVIRDDAVKVLAALRDVATGPRRTAFLPAIEHYGSALVNIGEVHAARRYVEEVGLPSEPLLLEVLGLAGERLGLWADAYEAYRRSDWPVHRHRAAMIGAILGRDPSETGLDSIDAPTRLLLGEIDGNLNGAELTRCVAFLNACLWHPVDDWRASLELGKLSVRRGRHAEADVHFARALRDAPEPARFPIACLKFSSLTWLSGGPAEAELRMRPEAVRDGYAALRAGEASDDVGHIATWLASETRDLGLIPAALDGWTAYDRAEAYSVLGDSGRAVDAWIESLAERYYHRAATGLIGATAPAGMRLTTRHLAAVVLQESDKDHLALWETADKLRSSPIDGSETATAEDAQAQHNAFLERLIELSRYDFKNTVRTFEFVARAGYEDLAEELLLDATKQADGVSDHLTVAVLRRRTQQDVGDDGLQALARARGGARHRLERLQLARELCDYGSLGDARRILEDERFLAPDPPLEPVETVVALGCGEVLTPQEAQRIMEQGVRRLTEQHAAGALGPRPSLFVDRLYDAIRPFGEELAKRMTRQLRRELKEAAPAAPPRPEEDWAGIIERAESAVTDAEEPDAWRAAMAALAETRSLGVRVTLASMLRATLAALERDAERTVPAVGGMHLPFSKDDRGDGDRAIELCYLWRSCLTSPGEAAEDRLRSFYADEQHELESWEKERAYARRATLRNIARVTAALSALLELPLPIGPRGSAHPVVRALYECVAADFAALAAEAQTRNRLVLDELGHDPQAVMSVLDELADVPRAVM